MSEDNLTVDEKAEKREKAREGTRQYAKKNLENMNLIYVGMMDSIESCNDYGDNLVSNVQEFKYLPLIGVKIIAYDLESGKEYDLHKKILLESRIEGESLSGKVSEIKLVKECYDLIRKSFDKAKPNDIYSFMGGKENFEESLNNVYVEDLNPTIEEFNKLGPDQMEIAKKDIKSYHKLVDTSLGYLRDKIVSDALEEKIKSASRTYEHFLKGENE